MLRALPLAVATVAVIALAWIPSASAAGGVRVLGGTVILTASESNVTFLEGITFNEIVVGSDFVTLDGVKVKITPASGGANVSVTEWEYARRVLTVTSAASVTVAVTGLALNYYDVQVAGSAIAHTALVQFTATTTPGTRELVIATYDPFKDIVVGEVVPVPAAAGSSSSPDAPASAPPVVPPAGPRFITPYHVALGSTAVGSAFALGKRKRRRKPERAFALAAVLVLSALLLLRSVAAAIG